MIYRKLIKPTFDRVIALLLIAMLLPFWIAGIAIVRLAQGAPIFYLYSEEPD